MHWIAKENKGRKVSRDQKDRKGPRDRKGLKGSLDSRMKCANSTVCLILLDHPLLLARSPYW